MQPHSRSRLGCALVSLRARISIPASQSKAFVGGGDLLASLEVLEEEYRAADNTDGAQEGYFPASAVTHKTVNLLTSHLYVEGR
jgi:hypothetical protein